jgi:hypothetical protein
MANKSQGGDANGKPTNKSAAIREVLAQTPKAKPKEVVAQLAGKGIKVAPTLVYYIKSRANQTRRRQKRERVAAASEKTKTANPVDLVLKVKALAKEAGGIYDLQRLVDVLAE